ncbi:MAG: hypothetical protein CVV42_02520 [Candidatus Riflebacteria bacterium HGW-Riflebacteria-2]|jgi:Spy/CpxP family protein refolding chaperone|nr:MAG: hypothetical protein CVV42_02520 [Candidatus Riflebacteria bacterium HGW-Riflebacteria-2]
MQKKFTLVLIVVFVMVTALSLHSAEKREVKRIRHLEIRTTTGAGNVMPAQLIQFFKFADALELSNQQLLQLRMLYQKQAESSKKRMQDNKHGKKLTDCDLTEKEVRKMAAEKAKQLEESIIARFKMQQEIKKIFTPEQLKKLEEMKSKKHARKGPPMSFWGKPGIPKPARRGTKDSPEALIDQMEEIFDVD